MSVANIGATTQRNGASSHDSGALPTMPSNHCRNWPMSFACAGVGQCTASRIDHQQATAIASTTQAANARRSHDGRPRPSRRSRVNGAAMPCSFNVDISNQKPVTYCSGWPLKPPPRRSSRPIRNAEKKIASCERSRLKWISAVRVSGAGNRKSISASVNASCACSPAKIQSAHTYSSRPSATSEAMVAASAGVISNPGGALPCVRNARWNRKK